MIEIATRIGDGDDMNVDDLPDPDARLLDHIETPQSRNRQRALFAGVAAKAFADRTGKGEPLETVLSDMLADVYHLCDAVGFDFEELRARGFRHYQEEIEGEG